MYKVFSPRFLFISSPLQPLGHPTLGDVVPIPFPFSMLTHAPYLAPLPSPSLSATLFISLFLIRPMPPTTSQTSSLRVIFPSLSFPSNFAHYAGRRPNILCSDSLSIQLSPRPDFQTAKGRNLTVCFSKAYSAGPKM